MRILDLYIFGPDEAQLQRLLGPISFGDSRWIRLLGPKSVEAPASVQPPENALLCRAMYEYGCLSQELFEGTPSFQFTWTAFRRLKRIDDGFSSRPSALDPKHELLRERVTARADKVVWGGPLREVKASDLEELFVLALGEVDSISQTSTAAIDAGRDSSFQPMSKPIDPDNLADAISSCSTAVSDLCSRLSGLVQSAILGCVPASSFDYRIYLILRDGLDVRERAEVFRAIREMYIAPGSYGRIPGTYLRLRHPTVLTPSMWRASSRWYHALRAVEEFYFFKHHPVVLWGKDMRDDLTEPSGVDVIRSAAIAVADLRNLIWMGIHDGRPQRLVDALLGRIPALWLLLARSTIATSPGEALSGCAIAGLPKISMLEELCARLANVQPEDLPSTADPIWRAAVEASSTWMDEIARMALERLEVRAEDVVTVSTQSGGPRHRRSG
jgi:hypothetical protein